MKNKFLLFSITSLLFACGPAEKTSDTSGETAATTPDSATATTPPAPQNCQSVIKTDKLGKADVYQESAKSISVSITMDQDASTMPTADGCYFDNKATVLAAKKTGSQVFKRTLQKDDLALFTKDDAYIEKAVLQQVTYKPTFNGQRYITLTVRLLQPDTKKIMTYTVFMNYFGEMVKVN